MTSGTILLASDVPENVRKRMQAVPAGDDPLAIEGDDGQILGYFVSPEQLKRLLENAYTEHLLAEVNAVIQETRADRAAENAEQSGRVFGQTIS